LASASRSSLESAIAVISVAINFLRNLEVLATYKGRLAAEWMLPQSGNQIGDTWVVGRTPWVWIWTPGAARADWIDP
jgi:hypothetical protein